MGVRTRVAGWIRAAVRATRPVDPEFAQSLARRWESLPEQVRTPAQVVGRHAVGCEGTHGVFPRCNLACTPCYHSRDANRVAVSGQHTVEQVREQMALLQKVRGPQAHAQLIGGEVSLLPPDDHFAALSTMAEHGRIPMSMSHGDFDDDYLQALVLDDHGRRRLKRVSFAGHFDSLMFGRRGIERPPDESSLNPYRQRFTEMFRRVCTPHRVRYFLAHNMTVTPRNVGQVAQVVRDCHGYGFGMFSFQPAAYVGDHRRWHEDYRAMTDDDVWAEIERGVGTRLPYRVFQTGDERCNRSAYGFYLGDTWLPLLDDRDPRDLATRDAFLAYLGGVGFSSTPLPLLAVKLARVVAAHPVVIRHATEWVARLIRRTGVAPLLRHRVRPVTFVMHSFMDAADVAPAWELLQQGQRSDDPQIAATQERLQACFYAMAHPETGELVPACVQHAVLDPAENVALRRRLPLEDVTGRSHGTDRTRGVSSCESA